VDDGITREAAKQEVIRRYFRYRCEYVMGFADKETVQRVELSSRIFSFPPNTARWWNRRGRPPRTPSGTGGERGNLLRSGDRIERRNHRDGEQFSPLPRRSSVVIHAIKHLADIPEKIQLLPSYITNSISSLKTEILKEKPSASTWKKP